MGAFTQPNLFILSSQILPLVEKCCDQIIMLLPFDDVKFTSAHGPSAFLRARYEADHRQLLLEDMLKDGVKPWTIVRSGMLLEHFVCYYRHSRMHLWDVCCPSYMHIGYHVSCFKCGLFTLLVMFFSENIRSYDQRSRQDVFADACY